jgi:hypothetical protein
MWSSCPFAAVDGGAGLLHPPVERERVDGLTMAGVGEDDGRPGEEVLLGPSVEQLACGRLVEEGIA